MEKQRKNWVLRAGSMALLLTLVTTCLLSMTLAKYTTSLSGKDTARVAKFDFGASLTAKDEAGSTTGSGTLTTAGANINIFKTAYDNAGGVTTVDSGSSDKLIAPGVMGSFEYAFTGTSEVAIEISFEMNETNAGNIPMLYEYAGSYYSDYYSSNTHHLVLSNDGSTITTVNVAGDVDDLAAAVASTIGVIPPNTDLSAYAGFTAANTTVNWYWPFEEWDAASNGNLIASGVGSDAYDTALGTAGSAEITLSAAATATQID